MCSGELGKLIMWQAWAIAAAFMWGLWGAASGAAAKHGTALGLLGGVILIDAVLVAPFLGQVRSSLSWGLVAAAVFGLLAYACFYRALSVGPTNAVVAITALYPGVTLLVSATLLSERPSAREVVGVAFAIVAILLLAGSVKD